MQHTALSWVNQTTCVAYSKCNQKPFSFNLPTLGNTWSVAELVQVGPKTCVADVAGIAVSSRCWTSGGHHDLFDCADGVENADCGGSGDCGVTWCHMVSHGVTWCHMVSHGVTWCHMVSHGVTIFTFFIFFPLQCNRYHLPSHSACTKSTGRWSKSFLQNYCKFLKHLWALQASSNTIREWL